MKQLKVTFDFFYHVFFPLTLFDKKEEFLKHQIINSLAHAILVWFVAKRMPDGVYSSLPSYGFGFLILVLTHRFFFLLVNLFRVYKQSIL
jgi:hypothetical protein